MAKNRILLIVAVALTLAGCSEYTRLIKEQDFEKMYQASLRYYDQHKFTKALQLLEDVAPAYVGSRREDTIRFYAASAYHHLGDFQTSTQLFEDFRRIYGGSSAFLEQAEYLYAMGFYRASPAPERDQANTHRAILAIADYLDRYPESPKKEELETCMQELRNKLWDKEFLNARSYYKTQRYKAAVVALRGALDKSPDNPHREEMMYLTARSGWLLARNSIQELQRDRYLSMLDYGLNLTSEFPESQYVREVNRMMQEAREYLAATDPDTTKTENDEKQPE